ncbi:DUF5133 domain-containing protein [Streptomyces sp. NPDC059072]|uniref:DUF5133 domain-containing protein n=1 Tax=Streptomyces sp. NPDC059072 TaxID=3346715 RepID=UPI00367BA425
MGRFPPNVWRSDRQRPPVSAVPAPTPTRRRALLEQKGPRALTRLRHRQVMDRAAYTLCVLMGGRPAPQAAVAAAERRLSRQG